MYKRQVLIISTALDVTEGIFVVLYVSIMGLTRCYKMTVFLWPPCGIGQAIIFLPCGFFLLLLSFFSSPNLSSRRLDVYHTSTHGVALMQI